MSLLEQKVLIFDCQTTGTRPGQDQLVEIAWTWTSALDSFPPAVQSMLVNLPEGEKLPKIVREITGLSVSDFAQAKSAAEVWAEFQSAALHESGFALAHYAQFERGFIRQLYADHGEGKTFPLADFCSYRIAKRLFPEAPSNNVRGLAGYLGFELNDIKRAADHVLATTVIWQRIASELHRLGVKDQSELKAWLGAKPAAQKVNTNFRVDRLKRLSLPKGPGIYRMLAKNGEILYVGKATSLHSRVNSYFRGGCTGDRRKLEMLARVWDVEVTECATPLEAALLENEEIKRLTPQYNRALRPSQRNLVYFSRDFGSLSLTQSEQHPFGPFREHSSVQLLGNFLRELAAEDALGPVFHEYVPEDLLKAGWELLLAEEKLGQPSLRGLLALGLRWSRRPEMELAEAEDLPEDGELEEDLELPPTPEEVAVRFRGLIVRAGLEYYRARRLDRLANAEVQWQLKTGEWRELRVLNGQIQHGRKKKRGRPLPFPWAALGSDDYDRLSVLHSELRKYAHHVETI